MAYYMHDISSMEATSYILPVYIHNNKAVSIKAVSIKRQQPLCIVFEAYFLHNTSILLKEFYYVNIIKVLCKSNLVSYWQKSHFSHCLNLLPVPPTKRSCILEITVSNIHYSPQTFFIGQWKGS